MGQSVNATPSPEPYTATGIWRMVPFLRPFLPKPGSVSSFTSKLILLKHLNTHLTIEFIPRAHINAHNKAASIITILISKFTPLPPPLWLLPPLLGGPPPFLPSRSNRCKRGYMFITIESLQVKSLNPKQRDFHSHYFNSPFRYYHTSTEANRTTKETDSKVFISVI